MLTLSIKGACSLEDALKQHTTGGSERALSALHLPGLSLLRATLARSLAAGSRGTLPSLAYPAPCHVIAVELLTASNKYKCPKCRQAAHMCSTMPAKWG